MSWCQARGRVHFGSDPDRPGNRGAVSASVRIRPVREPSTGTSPGETARARHNASMNADRLREIAFGLGLDAVGAAAAEPYERAENAIAERRAQGLFADMRFTTTRPELSCHPER